MKSTSKTKRQPVGDLLQMRQRIAQLEREEAERKQAEEALRASEERFRDLFENANDLIQSVGMNGGFVYVNKKWLETLGYSKEEVDELKLTDVLRKDQIPHCMELLQKVCSGESLEEVETVFVSKDDREIYVDGSVSARFEDGEFVLTRGIFRDVTERRKVEEALLASKASFHNIVERSADGIVVVDHTGVVHFVNSALEALLGRNAEELVGEHFGFPMAAGETAELDIVHRGGERAVAEMRVVETEWEGESAYLASLRDITERKQAEGEKQRMEQQLQLAGRLAAVGELAAGVAHELNNPLTSIQAYAQLLNDRTDLDDTIRDDVETIYREAQRASKITSNLLSFTRTHSSEKRPISINDALVSSLELHAYRMRVNNIDILLELEPDLPTTIADFHQMQQVFVNIITNAEHVMSEARGRGKLSLETQKVGEMIHTSFADDGPGIPEENIERIFDPFFTTKEVGKGTGLGLSICHGIVRDHGGCISVTSKPGQGTTFVVEIPIKTERELAAFYEVDPAMVHGQMDSVGKR